MKDWKPTLFKSSLTPVEAVEFRGLLAEYMQSHLTDIYWAKEIAFDITKADIVLWEETLFDLAWSGQDLFVGHTVPDDIGARSPELWLLNWVGCNEHDVQHPSQIMFVKPSDDQREVEIYDICPEIKGDYKRHRSPDGTSITVGGGLTAGHTLDHPDNHLNLMEGADWALIEFLKSPIVTSEREQFPRHVRRQFQRANISEPVVRTIRLRRSIKRNRGSQQGNIEYNYHWLVRPHWRNQYFPKTDSHKPVFVDAYVKGPEDKPFKPPKDYVFKVVR